MKQMHEWFPLTENNGIWTLTMNAPGNNLMTADFLDAYEITANEILTNAVNEKIKGLIICGGRHFSVGADVSALTERSAKELSNMQTGNITIPETHLYQKKMVTSWKNMPFRLLAQSAVSHWLRQRNSCQLPLQDLREKRSYRTARINIRNPARTGRNCQNY